MAQAVVLDTQAESEYDAKFQQLRLNFGIGAKRALL